MSEFHHNLPVKQTPSTTSKMATFAPIKNFKTSHGKK